MRPILIVVLLFVSGCRHVGPDLIQQEKKYWCWAASGQMIMEFYGHDVSQRTQADDSPKNFVAGQKQHDCITQPELCNWTSYPQFQIYPQNSDRTFSVVSRPQGLHLPYEALRTILCYDGCRCNPLAFQADRHMMVALEARKTWRGEHQVYVLDPGPWPDGASAGWIKYWEYRGIERSLHVDIYNIKPPQ